MNYERRKFMPKIFKENKLALALINIFLVALWIILSSFIFNFINYESQPVYINTVIDLFKYIPPLWLTYYLWITKKGFK